MKADDSRTVAVQDTQVAAEPSQTGNPKSASPLSATGNQDSSTTPDALKQAVDSANDKLKNLQNQSNTLEFSVDEDLGRVIVRLVDTKTHEVIRQYPPEEVLEIARQMDKLVGKLLKEKA